MSRIFLTGLSGFHGQLLGQELVQKGHRVSALVRRVSSRHKEDFPGVEVYWGDIRQPERLKAILKEEQPEVVINLAAQSSVEYSFSHVQECMEVNFVGLANLTSACLEVLTSLKLLIHASSVEVYGNQDELPLHEGMYPNPASPYGIAKTACEIHLRYLHQAHKFPFLAFRTANTYGRNRDFNFVIERIIKSLLLEQKEIKMGIPDSERDFLYVDDEMEIYQRAINRMDDSSLHGEIINTGTGKPISIRELFALVEDIIGVQEKPTVLWNSNSPRPLEIKSLTMDVSKAKQLLGWEPRTPLEQGIAKTIQFWKQRVALEQAPKLHSWPAI